MENLNKYVVRDSKGAVDLDATENKFRLDLQAYLANRAEQNSKVAAAVSTVFDRYQGKRINLPALETFVLAELGADPSNYAELSATLKSYIHDNAGPEGLFLIGKGKGGGCCRAADQTKPEQK